MINWLLAATILCLFLKPISLFIGSLIASFSVTGRCNIYMPYTEHIKFYDGYVSSPRPKATEIGGADKKAWICRVEGYLTGDAQPCWYYPGRQQTIEIMKSRLIVYVESCRLLREHDWMHPTAATQGCVWKRRKCHNCGLPAILSHANSILLIRENSAHRGLIKWAKPHT